MECDCYYIDSPFAPRSCAVAEFCLIPLPNRLLRPISSLLRNFALFLYPIFFLCATFLCCCLVPRNTLPEKKPAMFDLKNSSDESLSPTTTLHRRTSIRQIIGNAPKEEDATQINGDRESSAIIDYDDDSDSKRSVIGDPPDAGQGQFPRRIDAELRTLQSNRSFIAQSLSKAHNPDIVQSGTMSPRTLRRQMLATELTEELRKELAHERTENHRRPIFKDVSENTYLDLAPENNCDWRGW